MNVQERRLVSRSFTEASMGFKNKSECDKTKATVPTSLSLYASRGCAYCPLTELAGCQAFAASQLMAILKNMLRQQEGTELRVISL